MMTDIDSRSSNTDSEVFLGALPALHRLVEAEKEMKDLFFHALGWWFMREGGDYAFAPAEGMGQVWINQISNLLHRASRYAETENEMRCLETILKHRLHKFSPTEYLEECL